jgi:hypothetical protein
MQLQAPLLQPPIGIFPWGTHENAHATLHASSSHVGGVDEQLPPTHEPPPTQSALVQHAKEQTQLPPCLV